MKFVVATLTYWAEKGYNTSTWRKSVDGTKAMCHLEYGEILAKNIESNPNCQIYDSGSEEFQNLLASSEWTVGGGEVPIIEDVSLAAKVIRLDKRTTDLECGFADIIGGDI